MLDEPLKSYRDRLEVAINRALHEDAEIDDTIRAIHGSGYDVFLMIEATVGFTPKDEEREVEDGGFQAKLTPRDEGFLRGLRIHPR